MGWDIYEWTLRLKGANLFSPLESLLDYTGIFALLFLTYQIFHQRLIRIYFAIGSYAVVASVTAIGSTVAAYAFNRGSAFGFFFAYAECLQTIFLYLALIELLENVIGELQLSRVVRWTTLALLLLTVAFAWWKIQDLKNNESGRFFFELSANLYYIGMILSIILWGAIRKLHETRSRLVHLSLSLGVYFSAQAVLYLFIQVGPRALTPYVYSPMQIVSISLPIFWAFTFTMIPKTARLSPSQMERPVP